MSANTGAIRREDYENQEYYVGWYIPQSTNEATKEVLAELRKLIKSGEIEYAQLHLDNKDNYLAFVSEYFDKDPHYYKHVADISSKEAFMKCMNRAAYDEFRLLSWIRSNGYRVLDTQEDCIVILKNGVQFSL